MIPAPANAKLKVIVAILRKPILAIANAIAIRMAEAEKRQAAAAAPKAAIASSISVFSRRCIKISKRQNVAKGSLATLHQWSAHAHAKTHDAILSAHATAFVARLLKVSAARVFAPNATERVANLSERRVFPDCTQDER